MQILLYDYQDSPICHLKTDQKTDGECFGVFLDQDLNSLDELEFTLPYKIFYQGELVDNWRLDYLLPESIIRYTNSNHNYDEFFLVKNKTEIHNNGSLNIKVTCEHFSSTLQKIGLDKSIDMTDVASSILAEILQDSGYSVGTVSTFYEPDGITEKIRYYKKTRSNVLEMIYEIAELFEGYIYVDTVNLTVDLKDEIGASNGVQFRNNKNIRSLEREYNTSEIVTRMYCYGNEDSDSLTGITTITSNGQPFIDDFSYFEDKMTAAQLAAISTYNTDITTANTNITNTVSSISTTESDKVTVETNLETKIMQRATKQQLKDEIDAKIQIEKDPTTLAALQSQSTALGSNISTLDGEISSLQSNITGYDSDLSTYNSNLTGYLSNKNTIESTLKSAIPKFIKEGYFIDSNYISEQALYNDGLSVLQSVSQPKVSYTLDALDLSSLNGYELEKFNLGDIISIVDEELNIGVSSLVLARISKIQRNIDEPNKTKITISNYRGAFEDEYKRITKSSEIVKQRLQYYESAAYGLNTDGTVKIDLLQSVFNNNKLKIINGTNNKVEYSKEGIIVTDLDDSNKKLKINAGGLYITSDGGITWKVATSADGISALNIVSGVVDTKVIQIWNTDNVKFFWNSEALWAYGDTDNKWIKFSSDGIVATLDNGDTYEFALTWDGLTIGNTPASEIENKANNSIQQDTFYSRTKITNTYGIQVFDNATPTANERVRIGNYDTDKYGILIKASDGTTTMLSQDGMLQSWGDSIVDNVDSTHKLRMDFYVPDNAISIKQFKLFFRLLPFRAYSTGAASGGTTTTASGGGETSDPGFWTLSPPQYLLPDFMNMAGDHTHTINSAGDHAHTGNIDSDYHEHYHLESGGGSTGVNSYSHDHSLDVDSNGSHTHTMSTDGDHAHSMYSVSHVHDVSDHTHTISNHTHSINYGVYESISATNVKVYVNGVLRFDNDGSGYIADQNNIDLSSYITTSGWHYVELSSSQLGRISAAYFTQMFLSV